MMKSDFIGLRGNEWNIAMSAEGKYYSKQSDKMKNKETKPEGGGALTDVPSSPRRVRWTTP